jgi:N-acyl-D-aspartate/D-glutamate deacylase
MLDLKIVGGTIIDGSGRPRFRSEVGVKDGRIVALGKIAEAARETVDASGRIVSPGFIDLHTHYDVQVFWDPALSPSCYHGVTTVLGGMCGFSIAPLTPDAATYIKPMLARVEGMPLATLEAALDWDWTSFGDYLGRLDGRIGLNAGFFVGHSAIRRVVMGHRAVGEKASPAELAAMKELLGQSLAEGALGFSSSLSATHNDADGNPVPSRWADRAELIALGGVVRDHEGTGLELLPGMDFTDDTAELITQFSLAGNRPVNWNVLMLTGRPDEGERAARQLALSDYARARGGEVLALTLPCTAAIYMNLTSGMIFDSIPGAWCEMFRWPVEQRMARLRDPEFRRQLAADAEAHSAHGMLDFASRIDNYIVAAVAAEKNKPFEGRLIGDIAAEQDREPIDVMVDIALDDRLMTVFSPNLGGNDRATVALRSELWRDDRTLIGASDAGAHIDMIDGFCYSTMVLQQGVREYGAVTLEEAVYQMSGRSARYVGLIDRGLIAEGYHADIIIFDEATVGRGPPHNRYDVPGDEYRVYAEATGIDHVFVNGVQIVRDGRHTGALPGTVLRSGRDTHTVALDALREGRHARLEGA